jgi:hypothetical protein
MSIAFAVGEKRGGRVSTVLLSTALSGAELTLSSACMSKRHATWGPVEDAAAREHGAHRDYSLGYSSTMVFSQAAEVDRRHRLHVCAMCDTMYLLSFYVGHVRVSDQREDPDAQQNGRFS